MRALTSLAIILIAFGAVGAECPSTTWFEIDNIDARCPVVPDIDTVFVSIPIASTYLEKDAAGAVRWDQPRAAALKRLETREDTVFAVKTTSGDTVRVPAQDVTVNAAQLNASLNLAKIKNAREITSIALTIPKTSLFCNAGMVTEDVSITIPVQDANSNNVLLASCFTTTAPIDEAHVSLGQADDDAKGDPGVTIDFDLSRRWEGAIDLDPTATRWTTTVGKLQLKGSAPTNEGTYHNTIAADFSYSKNTNYLGDAVAQQLRTAYWYTAFLRPEATLAEGQDRDYVYGLRTEMFINLTRVADNMLFRGRRPFISLGVERVDPDKRQEGTVPRNYNRANTGFLWKFYPTNDVAVDISLSGVYIIDRDRAKEMQLAQWQKRFDIALELFRDKEFKPFLRYTRGETPPRFEFIKEVLVGIAWDYARRTRP